MDSMEMRRNAIVQLINEKETVTFAQLKEEFPDVSEMTLRTDLKCLDQEKKILRVHGGARSVQVIIGTDGFLNRKSFHNISAIFAGQIPDMSYLIYTTGLSCATELANLSKPTVMLPGGKLNRYSQSVFGFSAIRELERVNFNQAFLGVTGFHPEVGFSCGISDEAFLKQTAIRKADQVIVLMDSSKVGVKCSFSFGQLSDIDIVVSDGKLPKEFLTQCKRYGVQIL